MGLKVWTWQFKPALAASTRPTEPTHGSCVCFINSAFWSIISSYIWKSTQCLFSLPVCSHLKQYPAVLFILLQMTFHCPLWLFLCVFVTVCGCDYSIGCPYYILYILSIWFYLWVHTEDGPGLTDGAVRHSCRSSTEEFSLCQVGSRSQTRETCLASSAFVSWAISSFSVLIHVADLIALLWPIEPQYTLSCQYLNMLV